MMNTTSSCPVCKRIIFAEKIVGDGIAIKPTGNKIVAPVTGEIVEVNEDLEDSPELVNSDAFGDGWLFKIKLDDEAELADLLDAVGYANSIDED